VCKASRVAVQQAGTVVTVVIVMVVPPRPPYHIFWLTVAVVLGAQIASCTNAHVPVW